MSKGSAGSGEGGGNRSKGGSTKSAAAKRNPQRNTNAAIAAMKAKGDADFKAGIVPF